MGLIAYNVVSSLSIEMAVGTMPLKRLSFRPLYSEPIYVPMLRRRTGKRRTDSLGVQSRQLCQQENTGRERPGKPIRVYRPAWRFLVQNLTQPMQSSAMALQFRRTKRPTSLVS